ncbi:MAG: hypothetical protein KA371_19960 [Acidobacteria bacterium]|nr:hypothetical protein [Acidobacteriota bacterium]
MGEVLRTLSETMLEPRDDHNKRLFVDLSESVHIHYREHRLVFGVNEFRHFAAVVAEAAVALEVLVRDGYRTKSDPECRANVQVPTRIIGGSQVEAIPVAEPQRSKYFDERLVIEEQTPAVKDRFHVHYRDLRIVFNNDRTFLDVCDAFARAGASYRAWTPLAVVTPRWTRSQVGPLDHTDDDVPILVDQAGTIIDGHHRYYRRLDCGDEAIEVIRLAMSFDHSLPLRQFDLALKASGRWDLLAAYKRALVQTCRAMQADGAGAAVAAVS